MSEKRAECVGAMIGDVSWAPSRLACCNVYSFASDGPTQVLSRPTGGPDKVRFQNESWIRYISCGYLAYCRQSRWFLEARRPFVHGPIKRVTCFSAVFLETREPRSPPVGVREDVRSENGLDRTYCCFCSSGQFSYLSWEKTEKVHLL